MDDLGVSFPKHVKIGNMRLTILYYFCAISATAYVVYNFVTSRAYLSKVTPSGTIYFWAENWSQHEAAIQANAADGQKEFCTAPAKFEYCSDAACTWDHKGMQCIDICTHTHTSGPVSGDCLESPERFVQEENGMFFPTYYNESVVTQGHSLGSIPTMKNKQFLIKGVEDLAVAFGHAYFVDNPITKERERGDSEAVASDQHGAGLLTVLVDANGAEIQQWLPGEFVRLGVQTLLQLGGIDLDSVDPNFAPNLKEGAQIQRGLLARIAGVDVSVEMSYQNPEIHGRGDWKGPVCELRVHATTRWTARPLLNTPGEHSTRLRWYNGIRVQFTQSGTFGWVNTNMALIEFLTSVLVFIGLAKKVVFFFAMHCLGQLSNVYKRICFQKVSLEDECYGLAARLMSHCATFGKIQDTPQGITEGGMYKNFVRIFRHTAELNSREIKRFVKFVFDPMNGGRFCQKKDEAITVDEFATACSTNEDVTFEQLIRIFDAHREKGFLERCFMDDSIRSVFESDAEMKASQADNKESDLEMQVSPVLVNIEPKQPQELALSNADAGAGVPSAVEQLGETLAAEVRLLRQEQTHLRQMVSDLQAERDQFKDSFSRLHGDLEQIRGVLSKRLTAESDSSIELQLLSDRLATLECRPLTSAYGSGQVDIDSELMQFARLEQHVRLDDQVKGIGSKVVQISKQVAELKEHFSPSVPRNPQTTPFATQHCSNSDRTEWRDPTDYTSHVQQPELRSAVHSHHNHRNCVGILDECMGDTSRVDGLDERGVHLIYEDESMSDHFSRPWTWQAQVQQDSMQNSQRDLQFRGNNVAI